MSFGSLLGLVAIAVSMLGMTTTPSTVNTCACQSFTFTSADILGVSSAIVFSISFTPLSGYAKYNITVWASAQAHAALGFDGASWGFWLRRSLPTPLTTYQFWSDYSLGDVSGTRNIHDDCIAMVGGQTGRTSFVSQTIIWSWGTNFGAPIDIIGARMILRVDYY